jgi:phenylpropionate dioxygenase-like ring-hydroxylating dioxygenase large terminal subunit
MPNLPADQDFRHKVKARAYRAVERGGVVYVYMGEREVAPPLPAMEATLCPADETNISCCLRECNWLQALEGDIDTSHFSFLHTGKIELDDIDPDHLERFQLIDRAPRYHVQTTDWGAMYAAYRPAQPGHLYYRFCPFRVPVLDIVPERAVGRQYSGASLGAARRYAHDGLHLHLAAQDAGAWPDQNR